MLNIQAHHPYFQATESIYFDPIFKITSPALKYIEYTGMEGDGCGAKPEGAGNLNSPNPQKSHFNHFQHYHLQQLLFIFHFFRCCKREEQPLEEEEEVEQKDTGIP